MHGCHYRYMQYFPHIFNRFLHKQVITTFYFVAILTKQSSKCLYKYACI